MVEEIVDYRLARYLFTKGSRRWRTAFRLKVIQASGRPILMLDRDRNPGLPEGETRSSPTTSSTPATSSRSH